MDRILLQASYRSVVFFNKKLICLYYSFMLLQFVSVGWISSYPTIARQPLDTLDDHSSYGTQPGLLRRDGMLSPVDLFRV